jgi:hypothetical protein
MSTTKIIVDRLVVNSVNYNQMAKNQRTIKLSDVRQCGKIQCTAREAAGFLGIRVSTFNKFLQDDPKVKEAWEQGKQLGRISLRRKQFRLAGQNATMAIFLGKQYLSQRDIQSHALTDGEGQPLDLSGLSREERDQLRRLVARSGEQDPDS